MVRDNAETLARLDEEETVLKGEHAGSTEREASARLAFEEATQRLTASEAALAKVTAERAEANAARTQFERAVREHSERRTRLDRQLADTTAEMATMAARLAALPDPAEKKRLVERAESGVAEAEAAAVASERRVTEARSKEGSLRPLVQEARAALQRIETEARTLAKILNAGSSDLFPAVLEQIRVDRGFETALGAALGEDLDAPLDRAAPAHWGGMDVPAEGDPRLPGGVPPLADKVRAPGQLARRLAQIGIVDKEDGPRLQKLLAPGQRLVSRDGAVWRWDGFVAGADAPTAAAQRLAQKNRLAELDQEASSAAARAREAEAVLAEAEAAVRTLVDAEKAAREAWRAGQRALGEARDELAKAERSAGELATRRAALQEALARIEESRGEEARLLGEAEAALSAAADPRDLQSAFERQTALVAQDRSAVADARAASDGLKREAEARQRRLEAIAKDRATWISRAENADRQIAALGERRTEAVAEREAMADAPDELDQRRRALLSQLSETERKRREAADRLAEAETRQAALDKAANAAIQGLAESREARARAEERLNAADERRRDAEARIQEALGVQPHLVIRQTGLAPGDPLPDMAEVERKVDRLKIERERLGAVNLRAEEEQRELSDRLELIVSEREDIVEAIKKLRQAIQSLNKEGRDRLLAAFDQVNAQFQRLFTHLFGGGTAELQLIESDDPLEAGLEILARPPGKKPQTMTLLSGGEQALTAMALIFAVFLTNPAPICVLDEVDAPLDDHNVERFCNLMDEMARTTQTRFVIITHNPITMARMNRLFGVTMAEQGVSQLVSVDLQTAERIREAS